MRSRRVNQGASSSKGLRSASDIIHLIKTAQPPGISFAVCKTPKGFRLHVSKTQSPLRTFSEAKLFLREPCGASQLVLRGRLHTTSGNVLVVATGHRMEPSLCGAHVAKALTDMGGHKFWSGGVEWRSLAIGPDDSVAAPTDADSLSQDEDSGIDMEEPEEATESDDDPRESVKEPIPPSSGGSTFDAGRDPSQEPFDDEGYDSGYDKDIERHETAPPPRTIADLEKERHRLAAERDDLTRRLIMEKKRPALAPTSIKDLASRFAGDGDLRAAAETAESVGGMLAEHIVNTRKLATQKRICVFVRAVNLESTALIKDKFGTKDMAIKGKSSTIAPLSALIPLDQRFGKKAFDPRLSPQQRAREVAKLDSYNLKAIEDGKATAVDLKLSRARLASMPGLTFHGDWLDADPTAPAAGVITSASAGQLFHFWGERRPDGSVGIFHLDQTIEGPSKGAAFQVMGDRHGQAVTADYDLALVAPHVEDLSAAHMRSLKITSGEEMSRRSSISMDDPAPNDRQWRADQSLAAEVALRHGEPADVARRIREEPMPEAATRQDIFLNSIRVALASKQEFYDAVGDDPTSVSERRPLKDFGIVSDHTKDLLADLNAACRLQPDDPDVFNHGDDAGNPYSVEADNYPMTVVLPENQQLQSLGLGPVLIVNDGGELKDLFKILKDCAFMPQSTDVWDRQDDPPPARLSRVRSDVFTAARDGLQRLMATKEIERELKRVRMRVAECTTELLKRRGELQ